MPWLRQRSSYAQTPFFSGAAMVCQLQRHLKMKMKRESEDSQKKRLTLRRLPQCDDEPEKKPPAKRR